MHEGLQRDGPRYRALLGAVIMAVIYVAPAVAAAGGHPHKVNPYVAASRATGVPLALIAAIAGAESDYHPWALDLHGHKDYCRSRREAERVLAGSAPDADVDIGLMQINWRFWGPRLNLTKDQLLDPRTNLFYGALILKRCLKRGGSIWRRISDYHSGTIHERNSYDRRVYAKYLRYMRGRPR